MSGWGCPHEIDGVCTKLNGLPCDPGMKGCVLAGRYRFADESKNARFYEKKAREAGPADPDSDEGSRSGG